MRSAWIAGGALALCCGATAAAAPPDDPDTITVTGDRLPGDEARREAFDFVRRTGVAAGERPVARWESPVCPRAFGLRPEHARRVEATLRSVAKAAGAPVAPAACRANIAIVFAADAGAMVRTIAARAPRRFAEVAPAAREALTGSDAPVRWWYATELRGADGMGGTGAPPPWSGGNGEGGGSVIPDNGQSVSLLQHGSSLISSQAERVLKTATVVIDVDGAAGLPLASVAAYAALVSLAEIKPMSPPPAGSLLGLFEAGDARALTTRDRTLLGALYRLPLDRPARRQRGQLVRALVAAETGRDAGRAER